MLRQAARRAAEVAAAVATVGVQIVERGGLDRGARPGMVHALPALTPSAIRRPPAWSGMSCAVPRTLVAPPLVPTAADPSASQTPAASSVGAASSRPASWRASADPSAIAPSERRRPTRASSHRRARRPRRTRTRGPPSSSPCSHIAPLRSGARITGSACLRCTPAPCTSGPTSCSWCTPRPPCRTARSTCRRGSYPPGSSPWGRSSRRTTWRPCTLR